MQTPAREVSQKDQVEAPLRFRGSTVSPSGQKALSGSEKVPYNKFEDQARRDGDRPWTQRPFARGEGE